MSVNLVVNGNTYAYPEQSDTNWGSSATDWAQAVTVGMLQKAGGLFQLLAEVDLGTTYGVKSVYFKSRTALPADAGQLRLAKTDVINWRNDANDGNNVLSVNSSNDLLWNGTSLAGIATVSDTSTIDLTVTSNNLTADIIAGSITNAYINASAAIAYSKLNLSGSIVNADINASAAIAYSKLALTGSIVNADISASAAIAFTKLASLTSANILVGNGSNIATAVAVSGDISLSNAGVTAYAGTVPLNKGGTGQTTKAPAFDALSPMTTSGDIIYGGASGTGTRLAKGTDGQVLTLASGIPSWAAASGGGANTHLSNLTDTVAINKSLLFDTTDVYDIGADGTRVNKIFANTIQYNSAIRYNLLDNRVNDSSGNASIYPDACQLRTGSHGAPVTKLDWSGTTDLILGNSAGVVKTVTNIVPSAADTISLGTSSLRYANITSDQFQLYGSSSAQRGGWNPQVTTPSGATADSIRTTVAGASMSIWGASDSNSNSTKAATLFLEGGNKTAGTGNGGDVSIWTGTSSGGTRGTLFIRDKTFAGATNGDVLTLVSNSTGEVGFAAGGGAGASTALDNLTTTSINQSLIPADNSTQLGDPATPWSGASANTFYAVATSAGSVNFALSVADGAAQPLLIVSNPNSLPATFSNVAAGIYSINANTTSKKSLALYTANDGTGTDSTGTVYVGSGDVPDGAGDSGQVIIKSGNVDDGFSGAITLRPGTASTDDSRGPIIFDSIYALLPTGSADPSDVTPGGIYYNTGTDKLRLCVAGVWTDLN